MSSRSSPSGAARSSASGSPAFVRSSGRTRSRPRHPPRSHELRKSDHQGASWTAIVATVLILGGAFLFTAGAVLVAWPVWAAGLALFAGGFILYRP